MLDKHRYRKRAKAGKRLGGKLPRPEEDYSSGGDDEREGLEKDCASDCLSAVLGTDKAPLSSDKGSSAGKAKRIGPW